MKKLYYLLVILLFSSCVKHKRDFFKEMNPSIKDVVIDRQFYFLKGFGLSDESTWINGENYWKLEDSESSLFHLSGYLRYYHNAVFILPFKDDTKETVLFDFDAKVNSSWNMIYRKENVKTYGDSVILSGIRISNKADTIYNFTFHTFFKLKGKILYSFNDAVFNLDVSKKHGIIRISKLRELLRTDYRIDVADYELFLYPRQLFKNNRGNEFDI
jgi:hypothetical protein